MSPSQRTHMSMGAPRIPSTRLSTLGHDPCMRIVDVSALNPRTIEKFDSRGFTIGTLCPDAYVAAATLGVDGRIGRHPAVLDQCLLVIEGRASVSGGDGSAVAIEPGRRPCGRQVRIMRRGPTTVFGS